MRAAALVLWLAAVLLAPPAAAQSRQLGVPSDNGRGIRECSDLRAYVDLSEPGGRALRQGPGDEFPLLGRLTGGAVRDGRRRVPVEVTTTYNGWLRVRGPAVDAVLAELPQPAREQAGDNAWIVGWDVTADVVGSRGLAFPIGGSRVVFWTSDGASLAAHARLADIVACEGHWVYGRWEPRDLDRLRYIVDLRELADPPRVTAWGLRRWRYPTRENRRRAMNDWLVETYDEEEMSRAVRLSRIGDDFLISYEVSFWHGNPGPFYSANVGGDMRVCGDEAWRRDDNGDHWRAEADPIAAGRDLRARLVGYFEACDATPGEIAAALEGFDPAFALAAAWAEEDRRHVLALAEAIANDGAEPDEADADGAE